MSELIPYETGQLPDKAPSTKMEVTLSKGTAQEEYHRRFVRQWYMTYNQLSVPEAQRLEWSQSVIEGELVGYATSIAAKYPGIRQDVIFAAWDLGWQRYFIENGIKAFPIFNYAALLFWIGKYRHEVERKMIDQTVSKNPEPAPEGSKERTLEEMAQELNGKDLLQKKMILIVPNEEWQRFFEEVRSRIEVRRPELFGLIKASARKRWASAMAGSIRCSPSSIEAMEVTDAEKLFESTRGSRDGMPSAWYFMREALMQHVSEAL